jgi:hypothetical protein
MSIIRSINDWWDCDAPDGVVVAGKRGAVAITHVAPGETGVPAFDYYEKVSYVARGEVTLYVVDLDDALRAEKLSGGSFYRIPPTLISWVANTTDEPVVIMSGLVPAFPEQGGPVLDAAVLNAEWEDEDEFPPVRSGWPADPRWYRVDADARAEALAHPPAGLTRAATAVEKFGVASHLNVPLQTKMVCGERTSIMVADREGAYHSTPHVHPAEQINAVIQGSNWAYCAGPGDEQVAVETGAGSIFRFPDLVPHWAWGRGGGSTVVEFHFPGLHGDPDLAARVVSLTSGDPLLEPRTDRARNIFVDPAAVAVEEIESATV